MEWDTRISSESVESPEGEPCLFLVLLDSSIGGESLDFGLNANQRRFNIFLGTGLPSILARVMCFLVCLLRDEGSLQTNSQNPVGVKGSGQVQC